jgi:cephalosporin-C deacetylase
MPELDMPLEELRVYQGRNPKPADHEAYWEAALAQMRALDPQVELIPADFASPVADCYDLYFTGVGGARIHAKFLKPKAQKGKCPAIVQFHGYSGNCGDWHDKLHYAASGFYFASMDCRGQGGLSEDTIVVKGNTKEGMIIRGLDDPDPTKLYYRAVFLDAAQLARIVMDMEGVDPQRVGTVGGSQGGALSLACAALEPRISRAAAAFPFLSDYKRVWEHDWAERAYRELRWYFRVFDPNHEREDEVFTKLGYIDIQHLMPRMKASVMMFCGLMDDVCPPSTQFAAFNKIPSKKEVVIYPDYGHEGIPNLDDRTYQYMLEMV